MLAVALAGEEMTMVILHKNLDVYKRALEFVEIAAEIIKHVPRGQSYLVSVTKWLQKPFRKGIIV
jgi:hypothetical protein